MKTRILELAVALAEHHLGDHDMLGEWGRELYSLIERTHPEIIKRVEEENFQ